MRVLKTELRRWLGSARVRTGRVAAFAGRYYRGLSYLWNLLVWSRISAGRVGLLPVELPLEVLRHKGVTARPPHLEVAGSADADTFSRGFAEVYAILFANLQSEDLLSSYRHAIPGPAFRGVYLWDSAFIAQIWKCWDPQAARELLLSVIELRDGDRLQHVVTEFSQSRYTQPPLVAWSAMEVARTLDRADARAFIDEIYGPLAAYQRWLDAHRRLDNGLYFWAHPYESGVENAPRFSNTDESVLRNTRAMAAPDLCSYVILQLDALSEMARRLDRPAEAEDFAISAETLRERMNALLWSERDGLYYDLDGAGVHVPVSTIASLLPLWAGVPDPNRARRMVARIMDPAHYGTPMPLPSVDRSAHAFEKDMWRGPVWINTAYGVVQGLLRYGHDREAGELSYRLCRGVYQVFREERQIYEFYDPDSFHTRDLRRKRGNWWKAFTLGRGPQRDFVGWSGLVNTLFLELLLGLAPTPSGPSICPRLPPECAGMRFSVELPWGGGRLSLDCEPGDGFSGSWDGPAGSIPFRTNFAERIHLGS
ncbi:amylo-alpha-1,6-glucosidase [Imhoffiella purpurea]|uniref:Putative isomerase n=1 Tax=Imhoffiella purpurea TaxID=1249627 RepID=W9VEN7_9GAMM|nr:trehalase family glycosidase [Imhoffiella purpurea]EXJ14507.1 Putative isomerase [Imhoffiella purpurea]